jgi:hypothetical protein
MSDTEEPRAARLEGSANIWRSACRRRTQKKQQQQVQEINKCCVSTGCSTDWPEKDLNGKHFFYRSARTRTDNADQILGCDPDPES